MKWIKDYERSSKLIENNAKKIKSNLSTVVDTRANSVVFPPTMATFFRSLKAGILFKNHTKCHVSGNKILQTTVVAKPRAAVSI